jgi:hypothetical protein
MDPRFRGDDKLGDRDDSESIMRHMLRGKWFIPK